MRARRASRSERQTWAQKLHTKEDKQALLVSREERVEKEVSRLLEEGHQEHFRFQQKATKDNDRVGEGTKRLIEAVEEDFPLLWAPFVHYTT
jgi:hypothetical protein